MAFLYKYIDPWFNQSGSSFLCPLFFGDRYVSGASRVNNKFEKYRVICF